MTPFPASCMFDRHLQWNGMSTMSFVLERNAYVVRDVTLTVKLVYKFGESATKGAFFPADQHGLSWLLDG